MYSRHIPLAGTAYTNTIQMLCICNVCCLICKYFINKIRVKSFGSHKLGTHSARSALRWTVKMSLNTIPYTIYIAGCGHGNYRGAHAESGQTTTCSCYVRQCSMQIIRHKLENDPRIYVRLPLRWWWYWYLNVLVHELHDTECDWCLHSEWHRTELENGIIRETE